MVEPNASSASLPGWFDRWFEPRWRALLSWLTISVVIGWAVDHGAVEMVRAMVSFLFLQVDRVLPTSLPGQLRDIAVVSNVFILWFWIEPLALRLNLPRSGAWLGVRVASFVVVFAFDHWSEKTDFMISTVVGSVLAVPVLHGWRSRPWMTLIGGMIACAAIHAFYKYDSAAWLLTLALSLPYAAVLLYGTRRLPCPIIGCVDSRIRIDSGNA